MVGTQEVVDLFRRELRIANIRETDNFFELGGDSLMAEGVILALQDMSRLRLQTSILLEAPTPAELATRLGTQTELEKWSGLITAVPGCTGREPAFLVHGMAGSPLFANRFSTRFKDICQLYAIRGMGLAHGEDLLQSAREIVDIYMAAAAAVCGRTPGIFGGICVGSIIAIDMARRAFDLHKAKPSIILIDPPPLGAGWLKPMPDNTYTERRRAELDRSARSWRRLRDGCDRLGLGKTVLGRKARREAFKKSLTRAMAGYVPPAFPCDILVIASSEWGRSTIAGYEDWLPAEAELTSVIIEGNHKGFQDTNRDEIDRQIAKFLARHRQPGT